MKDVEVSILNRLSENASFEPERMRDFLETLGTLLTSEGYRVTSKKVVTYHALTDGKGVLTFTLGDTNTNESMHLSGGIDLSKITAVLDDLSKFAHKERMAISLGVSKEARGSLTIEAVTL